MQNTPLAFALTLLAGIAFTAPALAKTVQTAPVPHHPRHHTRSAGQQAAIAPLTVPAPLTPAADKNSAPVPDEWVTAPIDKTDQETTFAPSVMQIHYPPQGDGYTLGSSAQAMDDREAAKVTGVLMKMPLD